MKTDTHHEAKAPPMPRRGWVFYDGICPVCRASVDRWGRTLRLRGFGFATLQTDWVRQLLGLLPGELPGEMKLLLHDGAQHGGVDALIAMGRTIWWLWPLAFVARCPGINALARAGYRWIAVNRYCLGDVCTLPKRDARRPRHALTTFLELP